MKHIRLCKVYGLRWSGGYMKVSCGTWFCPNCDD